MMESRAQTDVTNLAVQVAPHGDAYVAATQTGEVLLTRSDEQAARQDGQTVLNWMYTLLIVPALTGAEKVLETVQ